MRTATIARLTDEFGQPKDAEQARWSIRRNEVLSLNFVVDTHPERRTVRVWIFDPCSKDHDGIAFVEIKSAEDLDALVNSLKGRLGAASCRNLAQEMAGDGRACP